MIYTQEQLSELIETIALEIESELKKSFLYCRLTEQTLAIMGEHGRRIITKYDPYLDLDIVLTQNGNEVRIGFKLNTLEVYQVLFNLLLLGEFNPDFKMD